MRSIECRLWLRVLTPVLFAAACSSSSSDRESQREDRPVTTASGSGAPGTIEPPSRTAQAAAAAPVPMSGSTTAGSLAAIGGSDAPAPGNARGTPGIPPATPAGAGAASPPRVTPPSNIPPTAPAPAAKPWNVTGTTCLQPGSGKYGEPGPYKTGMLDVDLGMIQPNQTNGKFTIFYPTPLEESCLHPIVAWGNGTGVNNSSTYAFFNNNAASWGIVVIASQDPNVGSGAFHKAGIDYLLKQNEDPMSMFYKKLSPRAGTSGHSQGAFGSVAGASHPNVGVNIGVGGSATSAAKYASMCLTGTEDIAADSCPALADRAQGPFFAASWNGGDHVTTQTVGGYFMRDPGTLAMQRFYAAWFRCFLADDGVACNLFRGATPTDCGVCKEMQDWAVLKSKNIP